MRWNYTKSILLGVVIVGALFACRTRKEKTIHYRSGAIKAKGDVKEDAHGVFLRTGKWVLYYESGVKKAEGFYSRGNEDGVRDKRGNLLDGREGEWNFWYEHGQLMARGFFRNGKDNGQWMFWHEDGEMDQTGSFRNGKPEGEWTSWYPNGTLRAKERFKKGKPDGEWVTWHKNGRLKEKRRFRSGKEERNLTHR